jgi:hypothetical protein
MAHHEGLTELLRVPSLRSIYFCNFAFTPALCQETANALMEGTAVTKLEFRECSFSVGERAAIMASGFSKNTSVSSIEVALPVDEALNEALAAALPSNSTLQELSLGVDDDDSDARLHWSPIFLALGRNTGLKTLTLDGLGSMDESLSTAIKNGLRLHKTLESLRLYNVHVRDVDFSLWYKAFSFLRTNKALRALTVNAVRDDVTKSYFRFLCRRCGHPTRERVT